MMTASYTGATKYDLSLPPLALLTHKQPQLIEVLLCFGSLKKACSRYEKDLRTIACRMLPHEQMMRIMKEGKAAVCTTGLAPNTNPSPSMCVVCQVRSESGVSHPQPVSAW